MSQRWGRAYAQAVNAVSHVQKPWRRAASRLIAAQSLAQRLSVSTRYGELVFVASDANELQYVRDFHSREPETLAWIDRFVTPCLFWDVGANIGSYALYAGLKPGVSVAAFEPAAANFFALCRNISANGLSERVHAYCLAFAERTGLGELNLSQANAGGVFNVFDGAENYFGAAIQVTARHGAVGFSIDRFRRVFGLPAPDYLKIDVDSVEERILDGARETLADPQLRSILIEMEGAETPRNVRLADRLRDAGLGLAERSSGNTGTVNAIFRRLGATTIAQRSPSG